MIQLKEHILRAMVTFWQMRWYKKIIAIYFAVGGLLATFVPLFPGTHFGINSKEITYVQAWKSGYAELSVLLGLVFLYVAKRLFFPKKSPK